MPVDAAPVTRFRLRFRSSQPSALTPGPGGRGGESAINTILVYYHYTVIYAQVSVPARTPLWRSSTMTDELPFAYLSPVFNPSPCSGHVLPIDILIFLRSDLGRPFLCNLLRLDNFDRVVSPMYFLCGVAD
uniref:Uncharacterized protein n=1 Tax=Schistocephalus solidus TaxID=70667 RepID=A0A0X3NGQ5_SCHSO